MQGGLCVLKLFHSSIALLLHKLYPPNWRGFAHPHLSDAGRGSLHD
jgi:hypothetical protein